MKLATFLPRFHHIASRLAAASVFAFATLLLTASTTQAQQAGVVAGTVLGAGGQPLPGAQIRVQGTELGTVTDASGRFRIAGLSAGQATIEVRRIGYRPVTQTVNVGAMEIRVGLSEQSVSLDEVVVTGTAGGQARREIGNAVSTINAAQVSERGTVNSIQQLLNGRAPGVFVNPSTGNVGGGARIRIRGAASLSLSNEPLIYVDGIRVNSQAATGPTNQGFGGNAISRINDINPDDIESVEIIKGPAAATLYGTEASGGVIQIITKKGVTGAPRWTFSTRQGMSYIQDLESRWPVNYNSVPRRGVTGVRDTISIDIVELEKSRGRDLFQNGKIHEYDISTSGGSDLFRYFAAGGLEDSEGVDAVNTVNRKTGRLNLTVTPSQRLNFGFNVGYTNGFVTVPCEAGCGGITLTSYLANPANDTTLTNGDPNPLRGFHSGLPEAYGAFYEFYQEVDRFTGGFQANQQLTSWLRHRLTFGADRTREENSELGRRIENLLYRSVLGTSGLGYRSLTFRTINNLTTDYSASALFDFTTDIKSTTSFGAQYYRNYFEISCAYGEQFPALGITTVSSTATAKTTCHDVEEDATLGFFLQEQVGWKNRLFLVAAVRADDNSAFGRNFDRVYYPKFSASWVLSDEPFFSFPIIDQFKLRAAYGESGKQPTTFSALQTYTTATGAGGATVTPVSIGNPDLGPERSKEVELGFDAGAWQDRVGVEVTWYNKRTSEAILDRQIAPSIGIPGTQPFNAGAVKNWGTELLLRVRPYVSRRFDWETTLSYATNDSEILDLGTDEAVLELRRQTACPGYVRGTSDPSTCVVADFVNASSAPLSPRHQVGHPIGSIFHKRIVSAELSATGAPINVMCDDGKGGSVACATAPFVYLGRTIPNVEGAWGNTVTLFENVRIHGLIDFKRGHTKVNGSDRFRCVVLNRCRERWYSSEFDPKRVASVKAGTDALPDSYINDASFARFRELSVSYTLPAAVNRLGRFNRAVVTLAGRNLHTWTDYPGLDPEASFLGGVRGGNFSVFEQTVIPPLTQWVLGVNLDW
ncbi:MAG: SusC/RagA family TonB-linked outer membrane protein [Gemmatimonadota bacterium]|nr:SusC/RagA family TonB-linked outer membrane protein [Gemmatimonadota bacterium]